jgi:hypothetical protein
MMMKVFPCCGFVVFVQTQRIQFDGLPFGWNFNDLRLEQFAGDFRPELSGVGMDC